VVALELGYLPGLVFKKADSGFLFWIFHYLTATVVFPLGRKIRLGHVEVSLEILYFREVLLTIDHRQVAVRCREARKSGHGPAAVSGDENGYEWGLGF
jgi:hypothetical protein